MGRIVAIGEAHRARGFGLVGCEVVVSDAEGARRAWAALGDDVDLVVLTPAMADALVEELQANDAPLVAVMPE